MEHAKTCVLGGKLYVFYTDQTHATGVVFNHIYEFRGLIANGQFLSLESLNHDQKVKKKKKDISFSQDFGNSFSLAVCLNRSLQTFW